MGACGASIRSGCGAGNVGWGGSVVSTAPETPNVAQVIKIATRIAVPSGEVGFLNLRVFFFGVCSPGHEIRGGKTRRIVFRGVPGKTDLTGQRAVVAVKGGDRANISSAHAASTSCAICQILDGAGRATHQHRSFRREA
jgi:hypothetical protein